MDYFDQYLSRVTRFGANDKERAQTFVRKEYHKFIAQSPTQEHVIINDERVLCSIQTERFRDEKNQKYLVTEYTNEFPLGSLVHRPEYHDEIWMLLRHEPHPFDGDNRYIMIQLKHHVQWVDDYGVLHSSPCMVVGTMDAKIKDNFRTWNNLITPQPNKTLEIIMPSQFIKRTTKVLLDDEAWYLVDYDKQTIPGVIYLSFTESAVNPFDDDVEHNIGDSDKIGIYEIKAASNPLVVTPNVVTPLKIAAFKKGNLVAAPLKYHTTSPNIVLENDTILVTLPGDYEIDVALSAQQDVTLQLKVLCTTEEVPTAYSIKGNSSIKWGRQATYYISRFVNGIEEVVGDIPIILTPTRLAAIAESDNGYILSANTNNETGIVYLTAEVNGETLTRTVKITSLWS